MRVLREAQACLLVLGLIAAVPAVAQDDLMQEVEALGDKVEKAIVEDDTDFMFSMYAEDAISLPNFGPRVEGIEALKQHHAEMTAAGMNILSFESDPTDVWACGDQVIEIGNFEIALEVPDMSEPVQDKGKYMTVYTRDAEGNLKIKAETWNTDLNPMEMAPPGHEHDHDHDHGHDHDHEGEAEPES